MAADEYLRAILARERVDTSASSPVLGVQRIIAPIVRDWAGSALCGMSPSGSFAKGTANNSGTDIDLFVSLSSSVTMTLKEIYESLFATLQKNGYSPRRQNVSIGIRVGAYDVDMVPAKRQDQHGADHSLYRRRLDTWTKTNVANHIAFVSRSGRAEEIRILKLWRKQKGIDFPSFYLELSTITALDGRRVGNLAANVQAALEYFRDRIAIARVLDPANGNNVISGDLTVAGKAAVAAAARAATTAESWGEVVR
ncbi:MAG: hypothetical protein QOJ59_4836 [Thermomicrobiales bacterium]|nr:hypothetical protein [Thermomicrobiales bacterium]